MARTNNRLTNQGVWIGAGPGSEDASSLFIPGQLGMVYVQADKVYQFVQFDSSTVTVSAKMPVAWVDVDDFTVTTDISDTYRNLPAGVALGTQTASYYGWIQVAGPCTAVVTDGTAVAAGDTVIYCSTDGCVSPVAAGTASTYAPVGIATAANSGATVNINITAPHNGW